MAKQTQEFEHKIITIFPRQIRVPEEQVRSDLPKIPELAEDIKRAGGLLEPMVVENGGEGDQPYDLVAGKRRLAAFEHLKWLDRPTQVMLRIYPKNDPIARLADHWAENYQREDISHADRVAFINKLRTGTYATRDGQEATALTKEEVEKRFGVSSAMQDKLLRVHKNVPEPVLKAAQRAHLPVQSLIHLATIKGEATTKATAKDPEPEKTAVKIEKEIEQDKAQKMLAVVDSYEEQRKSLAAEGRQRLKRGTGRTSKKKSQASQDPSPIINLQRTVDPPRFNDEGEKLAPRRSAGDYLRLFQALLKDEKNKTEQARLEGRIETLRFMARDLSTFKGVTKGDWKLLDPKEDSE